ncbi:hypothetical protein FNF31_02267 [Cafeteria roenbergensis]|uniref:PKD/REJ-like domain-containing protein n=1 Tax=Cafeteria roenbergensis TaxID=33653 RepID=A0A5A8DL82_CAFRO|nr:hypothetical protein FNF31_02267 [Cafeteria roenbergensis]
MPRSGFSDGLFAAAALAVLCAAASPPAGGQPRTAAAWCAPHALDEAHVLTRDGLARGGSDPSRWETCQAADPTDVPVALTVSTGSRGLTDVRIRPDCPMAGSPVFALSLAEDSCGAGSAAVRPLAAVTVQVTVAAPGGGGPRCALLAVDAWSVVGAAASGQPFPPSTPATVLVNGSVAPPTSAGSVGPNHTLTVTIFPGRRAAWLAAVPSGACSAPAVATVTATVVGNASAACSGCTGSSASFSVRVDALPQVAVTPRAWSGATAVVPGHAAALPVLRESRGVGGSSGPWTVGAAGVDSAEWDVQLATAPAPGRVVRLSAVADPPAWAQAASLALVRGSNDWPVFDAANFSTPVRVRVAALVDERTLPDNVPVGVRIVASETSPDGGSASAEARGATTELAGDYDASGAPAACGAGPCWASAGGAGWCADAAGRSARLGPTEFVAVADNSTASATLTSVGSALVAESQSSKVRIVVSELPVTGHLSVEVRVNESLSSGLTSPWQRASVEPAGVFALTGDNATGSARVVKVSVAGDSIAAETGSVALTLVGWSEELPRFRIHDSIVLQSPDYTGPLLRVDDRTTRSGSATCSQPNAGEMLLQRDPSLAVLPSLSSAGSIFIPDVTRLDAGSNATVMVKLPVAPLVSAKLDFSVRLFAWDDAAGAAVALPGDQPTVSPSFVEFSAANSSTAVPLVISLPASQASAWGHRNATVALEVVRGTSPLGSIDPYSMDDPHSVAHQMRLPMVRGDPVTSQLAGVLRLLRGPHAGILGSTSGCQGSSFTLKDSGTQAWTVRLATVPSSPVRLRVSSPLLASKQLLGGTEAGQPAANVSDVDGSLSVDVPPSLASSGVVFSLWRNASSVPGLYPDTVRADVVGSADASYAGLVGSTLYRDAPRLTVAVGVSPSPTPTRTPTPTPSTTKTASPTPSTTKTASPTPSTTKTASPTPSTTKTASPTPSTTMTASPTPTNTPTPSVTASPTGTPTPTQTPTSSVTPTASVTASPTPTSSLSPGASPSVTASTTPSAMPTPSPALPVGDYGPAVKLLPGAGTLPPAQAPAETISASCFACSDVVVDALSASLPVPDEVLATIPASQAAPLNLIAVIFEAVSGASAPALASDAAAMWSLQQALLAGAVGPATSQSELASLLAPGGATFNATALGDAACDSATADSEACRSIRAVLATTRSGLLAMRADLPAASATTFMSGSDALGRATPSMLAWAQRAGSAPGTLSIPQELLTSHVGPGASDAVIRAHMIVDNSIGRASTGVATLTVQSSLSASRGRRVQVILGAGGAGSATTISGLDAVTVSAKAAASDSACSTPGPAPASSWRCELDSAASLNASAPPPPPSELELVRAGIRAARQSTPGTWRIAAGLFRPGYKYLLKVTAVGVGPAVGTSLGPEEERVNASGIFTVAVPLSAGLRTRLSVLAPAHAPVSLSRSTSASFRLTLEDMDGAGADEAGSPSRASLNWTCLFVPNAMADETLAFAPGDAVTMLRHARQLHGARDCTLVSSPAMAFPGSSSGGIGMDLSSAAMSSGATARIVASASGIERGSAIIAAVATSQTSGWPARTSTSASVIELRHEASAGVLPQAFFAFSSGSTSAAPSPSDGVPALAMLAHAGGRLTVKLTAAPSVPRNLRVEWAMRRSGSTDSWTPVGPDWSLRCAMAVGAPVFDSVPVSLREAVAAANASSGGSRTFVSVARAVIAAETAEASVEQLDRVTVGIRNTDADLPPALPLGWVLGAPNGDGGVAPQPWDNVQLKREAASRWVATLTKEVPACALAAGSMYDVIVTARPSAGASAVARGMLRLVPPPSPKGGQLLLFRASGAQAATSSGALAQVESVKRGTAELASSGWSEPVSHLIFAAAPPLSATGSGVTASESMVEAMLLGSRSVVARSAEAASALRTVGAVLPAGVGAGRVLTIAAVVQSASGALTVGLTPHPGATASSGGSRRLSAGPAAGTPPRAGLRGQSKQQGEPHGQRARALQEAGSARRLAVAPGSVPADPVGLVLQAATAVPWEPAHVPRLNPADPVISRNVSAVATAVAEVINNASVTILQPAALAGDSDTSTATVAALAALASEAESAQTTAAASCGEEVIAAGPWPAGPHHACYGNGYCRLTGPRGQTRNVPAACDGIVRSARVTANAAASQALREAAAAAGAAAVTNAGCAFRCRCDTGWAGSGCGAKTLAWKALVSAKGILASALEESIQNIDPQDTAALTSAAEAVGSALGDPETADIGAATSLTGALEGLISSAIVGAAGAAAPSPLPSAPPTAVPVTVAAPVAEASENVLLAAVLTASRAGEAQLQRRGRARRILQASDASEAKTAAELAFRSAASLESSAVLGYVMAGTSYSGQLASVQATPLDGSGTVAAGTGVAIAEGAGSRLRDDATANGAVITTTRWLASDASPFAAAALAARAAGIANASGDAGLGIESFPELTTEVTEVSVMAKAGSPWTLIGSCGNASHTAIVPSNAGNALRRVPVTCLSDPLVLRFALAPGTNASSFVPVWFGGVEQGWSTAGTIVVDIDPSGAAVVATTHLTAFSAVVKQVFDSARPLPSFRDAGKLLLYSRPENVLPISVVLGIVVIFASGWITSVCHDAGEEQGARMEAARRALLLVWGTTSVSAPERVLQRRKLAAVRSDYEIRKLHTIRRRRSLHDSRRRQRRQASGGKLLQGGSTGASASGSSLWGALGMSPANRSGNAGVLAGQSTISPRGAESMRSGGLASASGGGGGIPIGSSSRSQGTVGSGPVVAPRGVVNAPFSSIRGSKSPNSLASSGSVETSGTGGSFSEGGPMRRRSLLDSSFNSASTSGVGFGGGGHMDGSWSGPCQSCGQSVQGRSIAFVCSVYVEQFRTHHPFAFLCAPHEALVIYSRAQRVAVLGAEWLTSMAVSAVFFGRQPFLVEVRLGVGLLSALAVLPAAVIFPTAFRRAATIVSRSKRGEPVPTVQAWYRAVHAARMVRETDEKALSGRTAQVAPMPVALKSSVQPADATTGSHCSGGGVAVGVSVGVGAVAGRSSSAAQGASQAPGRWVHDSIETASDAASGLDISERHIHGFSQRDSGSVITPTSQAFTQQAIGVVVASSTPPSRSDGAPDTTDLRDPAGGSADGPLLRVHHATADESSVVSHAPPTENGDVPLEGASRRLSAASPIRRAKAGRASLLSMKHAAVVVEFSPFFRGAPDVCGSSVRVATLFIGWCGVTLCCAAALLAVAVDGSHPGSATTPLLVLGVGIGVILLSVIAMCSNTAARRQAEAASALAHGFFLRTAARSEVKLVTGRRERAGRSGDADSQQAPGDAADAKQGGEDAVAPADPDGDESKRGGGSPASPTKKGKPGVAFALQQPPMLSDETEVTGEGETSPGGSTARHNSQVRRAEGLVAIEDLVAAAVASVDVAQEQAGFCGCLGGRWTSLSVVLLLLAIIMQGLLAALLVLVLKTPLAWEAFVVMASLEGVMLLVLLVVLGSLHCAARAALVTAREAQEERLQAAHRLREQVFEERHRAKDDESGTRGAATVQRGRMSFAADPSSASAAAMLAKQRAKRQRDKAARTIQSAWRGFAARRLAMRLQELRVWEGMHCERQAVVTLVYASLLLLMLGSSFVCLVFGVVFAPEQARAWVLTTLVAFLIDAAVQEPIAILINALVLIGLRACGRDTVFCHNLSPNFLPSSTPWFGM